MATNYQKWLKKKLAWLGLKSNKWLQMIGFVLLTPINHTYSSPRAFCPCAQVARPCADATAHAQAQCR